MSTRGFPTAPCAPCGSEQLVWREPSTGLARCLRCDAAVEATAVRPGDFDAVARRNDWIVADVTASAEPCGCDTCPASEKCGHAHAHPVPSEEDAR